MRLARPQEEPFGLEQARQLAVLTVPQVCRLLNNTSPDLVYDAIKRGEIRSLRLGRKILIPTAPLLARLAGDGDD
jgi:excisionase family DNA binding protein